MWIKAKDGKLYKAGPGCCVAVEGSEFVMTMPGTKTRIVLEADVSESRGRVLMDRLETDIAERRVLMVA